MTQDVYMGRRAVDSQAAFEGVTWEEIGGALGVSRQAAWERYSID
jgi:hypothetical protein